MDAALQDRLDLALEAAWQAGRITLRYYQAGVQPEWKADESPVTVADREAEQKIRQLLERSFPGDGIVGEEYGRQEGSTGYRWLLDPIDGTKAFVQGVPLYGVLIGIETPQGVQAGVVLLPALNELVWAAAGAGCWWNGRRAQVSAVDSLREASLIYTESGSFAKYGRGAAWEALCRHSRIQRGWGDCYGHVLVATGRAEACFDPVMNPWDCGPLLPILQEAGGTFTDWQGKATVYGEDAFSTNGKLFPAVMAQLGAGT